MEKKFKDRVLDYFEEVGRKRAADQLRNLGYSEHARRIMEKK